MKPYTIPILGVLAVTLIAVFWYAEKRDANDAANTPSPERQAACEQFLTVAIFESGEAADEFMEACLRGEPVLPEEQSEEPVMGGVEEPTPVVAASCAIGGCSGQICGEAGEAENAVTTCEYREEYACYAHSRCERQSNGRCGWTETTEYNRCIADVSVSY
jgi:eight-cysteine-cluster-containing protein